MNFEEFDVPLSSEALNYGAVEGIVNLFADKCSHLPGKLELHLYDEEGNQAPLLSMLEQRVYPSRVLRWNFPEEPSLMVEDQDKVQDFISSATELISLSENTRYVGFLTMSVFKNTTELIIPKERFRWKIVQGYIGTTTDLPPRKHKNR